MATKYDKIKALWEHTTKENPYYEEVKRDECWWRLDSYLVDSGIAADILEDKYIGIKVKGCPHSTLERLWNKLGTDRIVKDWMMVNDKEEDIEKGYNLAFWTANERSYYEIEEVETVEPLAITEG